MLNGGAGQDTLVVGYKSFLPLPDITLALSTLNTVAAMSFEAVTLGYNVQLLGTDAVDRYDFSFSLTMIGIGKAIMLMDGDDSLSAAGGQLDVFGGTGNDTLEVGFGFGPGPEASRLHGDEGNDRLIGGDGNDHLSGDTGADYMEGGDGSDSYEVDSINDVIVENGVTGTDTVVTSLRYYRLAPQVENLWAVAPNGSRGFGNAGANDMRGGGGNDSLTALLGNDTLTSSSGRDTLVGGRGDDTYQVYGFNVVSVIELAGEGVDTVMTQRASYQFGAFLENLENTGPRGFAGTGNALGNRIRGGGGNDSLYGMAGDDSLYGGVGVNNLFGGAGDDTYWLGGREDTIVESPGGVVDRVFASSFTLSAEIENLFLLVEPGETGAYGGGNDLGNLIVGTSLDDHFGGEGGNDSLVGRDGRDTISGSDGADTLDGGNGVDFLNGGRGNDFYRAAFGDDSLGNSIADHVYEEAGGGIDTIVTAAASAKIPDYVEIFRTTFSVGTVNSDGASILGNDGNNQIFTGMGRDTLMGGFGRDTLLGGAGDDLYGLFAAPFSRTAVTTIPDFVRGSDQIALVGRFWEYLGTEDGPLSEAVFQTIGTGQVVEDDDRVLYNPVTGNLYFDQDGSGFRAAQLIGVFSGHPALDASDFVVIFGEWPY